MPLINFAKGSILDVLLASEYAFAVTFKNYLHPLLTSNQKSNQTKQVKVK